MPQPPSTFENFVGSFLASYGAMSDRKQQRRESAARERESRDASRLRQAQLADSGYVVQDMTVPDTTDRNWLQGVGHALFGSEPEHREALLKVGPSAAERAASSERDFTTGRDTAHFQNEKDIEQLKAGIAAANERTRQAGEDKRAAGNNATSLRVAQIDHSVQAQALADKQRTEFFDSAVAAAGGDPVQAMRNVEQFQMPLARKFRATRTDYHAAAARYRDSKAALTREGIDAANERAAARSGTQMLPRDLNGKPIPSPAPAASAKSGTIVLPASSSPSQPTSAATPNATTRNTPLRSLTTAEKSQAQRDPNYAAQLTSAGYSGRDVFGPLRPSDKANAKTDPGFAQHLTGLGYKQGIDF